MKHAPKNVQLTMCLKDPNGVELSEWIQDFKVKSLYDQHCERWICHLNGHIQFFVPE